MAYKIDADTCVGCAACEGSCPVSAIAPKDDKYAIDAQKCNYEIGRASCRERV